MADFNVNHITGKQGQQGTVLAGVTTVSSTGAMRIPSGPTEQRGGRGRMVMAGGYVSPTASKVIDYITIATIGNETDFGSLGTGLYNPGGCASATRGLVTGGEVHPVGNTFTQIIEYVTISSNGGGNTFGDLTGGLRGTPASLSDSTRGVTGGGGAPNNTNIIDYVTIATIGDATDFGDLTEARGSCSACASPTRGVFTGGHAPYSSINIIEYVTIQSKGDAKDFGDLLNKSRSGSAFSNTTRGIHGGGLYPTYVNVIQYFEIASLGNAIDFGDLTATMAFMSGGCSSTRGIFAGGYVPSPTGAVNTIQYVTIATTGNTTDFGDRGTAMYGTQGFTDVHGGLG